MTEGLDLYDDVLTTGGEMPVGAEDEVLQTQVWRTKSYSWKILLNPPGHELVLLQVLLSAT